MDSVDSRRNAIAAFINEHGEITFAQLKKEFSGVSDMTLRTDLKFLDEHKRIVRIHGGAKSVEVAVGTDDYLGRRSVRNVEAKKIIADKAITMIRPGTDIYLDSGSTTTMLAARMPDQANLIVTGSISCAMELSKLSQPKVLIPGGMLNRYSMSICGIEGISELAQMNFDYAFMGVTTWSEETGFACNVQNEAELKRTVMKRAVKTVMLMDSTKVGGRSTFSFGSLHDVDVVISDGNLPKSFLQACKEQGVEVH